MNKQSSLLNSTGVVRRYFAAGRVNRCLSIMLCLVLAAAGNHLFAQPLVKPLAVTGFTQDLIAESGTNAAAKTSAAVDNDSNIIYSQTFGNVNGIGAGLPDNGTIVYNNYTYQLAPYTGNNALLVSDFTPATPKTAVSGTLTLTNPAVLSWISVLTFSAEGDTYLTATINYTDGTSDAGIGQDIYDWFWYWYWGWQVNPVVSGIGRTRRLASGPYIQDGTDPYTDAGIYNWDILVPCASQGKVVKSITFTAAGGHQIDTWDNSPYRAIILAVSGIQSSKPTFTASSLPDRCGSNNNGMISLTTQGGATPFSYSWNTNPAQTNSIAANLPAGTYTCAITDSNGCSYNFIDSVLYIKPDTIKASTSAATVCPGISTTLSATSSSSLPVIYTWAPGGLTGASVSVAPTTSTTYVVTALDFYGCTSTDTVKLAVKYGPAVSFTAVPDTFCASTPTTLTFTGRASSAATYNWNNFAGAAVKSGSGAGPYSIQFSQAGTYDVQLEVTDSGCTSPAFTKALTAIGPGAAPIVSVQALSRTAVTFGWLPVAGAAGYEVSINGGPYGTPTADTTEVIAGLQPNQTVTISVIALSPASCQNSPAGAATAKTPDDDVYIPNSFSPNGDGKNDIFKIYSTVAASMEMRIFNQWGDLVFETNNLTNGWDGTYKGKPQPSGVYIYVVRVKLRDGSESVRKGAINLLH